MTPDTNENVPGGRIFPPPAVICWASPRPAVRLMKASGDAYPDPNDGTGKLYAVDVAPVGKLRRPVTLAEIKADKRFAEMPLTRIPRLSVMPVTDAQWKAIEDLSAD